MADSSWWDRFTNSAATLWNRLSEETGINDVVEEWQRFDDPDMSVMDYVRTAGRLVGQATVYGMPQALVAVPLEVNRAVGQDVVGMLENVRQEGLSGGLIGLGPLGSKPAANRWGTYATGGLTAEQRDQMATSGLPKDQIDAFYGPVSASDALTVGIDKIRNRFGSWATLAAGPLAVPYWVGEAFNTVDGEQRHGSYLPAAFDLTTPNAGYKLWTSSGMTHQLIGEQLLVETMLDPFLWGEKPIRAALTGRRAPRLEFRGAADVPGSIPSPDAQREAWDAVTNQTIRNRRWLRGSQWAPGRGTWDQGQFLDAVVNNRGVGGVLTQFAQADSLTTVMGLLRRYRMAEGEGADVIGSVLARMNTEADVANALYAGAFRDKAAMDRVLETLEAQVDSMPAAEGLRQLTGTGSNILERSVFEYGGDSGLLPAHHPLNLSGPEWVAEAIRRADAEAGLAADDAASLTARWDALVDSEKGAITRDLDRHRAAMKGAVRMLEEPASQLVTRMGRAPTDRALRRSARGTVPRQVSESGVVAQFLAEHRIPVLTTFGKTMRTSPSLWLLSRPGLTFELHGMDAVHKFDGIVAYVDGIIGPRGLPVAPGATARVRFLDDPVVAGLRERFAAAGSLTRDPQQLRAALVDELQQYAVSRIAVGRGVEPAAAALLAERGMAKARDLADALNNVERGYVTTLMEDGRPQYLAGHPGAIPQTANHIPLMDLKALDSALRSTGVRRAILGTDELLSVASMRNLIKVAEGAQEGGAHGAKVVRDLGRSETVQALHHVVDLADMVNTLFKKSVLLRLGYPVRNLAEAHLSAMASGVGWLNVMGNADLVTLLGNFGINLATTPTRFIDRRMTMAGLWRSEETIVAAGRGTEAAIDMAGDNIARAITTMSDPDELARLARIAASPTADPARRDAAAAELTYLVGLRLQVMHRIDSDMASKGLLGQTPGVPGQADGSGVFYHADSTGRFDGRIDPADLDGPLAVTEDPMVAQTGVEAAWADAGRWQDFDHTVEGTLRGGVTLPPLMFTTQQSDALRNLALTLREDGRLTRWRLAVDGHLQIPSEPAARELLTDLAAIQSRVPTPVDVDAVRLADIEDLDPTWLMTRRDEVGADLLEEGFSEAQVAEMLDTPAYLGLFDGDALRADLTIGDVRAAAASVGAGMQIRPQALTDFQVSLTSFLEDLTAPLAVAPFPTPAEKVLLRRVTDRVNEGMRWHGHQLALRDLARKGHVQYRSRPDGAWVDWTEPLPVGPSAKARAAYEFRTVPRNTVAPKAQPEVIRIDAWGPQVDLTDPDVVDALFQAHGRVLSNRVFLQAVAGDRAAQRRLSDVLAREGFYRIRLPDTADWNGSQVLLHPDAIGPGAYRRHLGEHVEDLVRAATGEASDFPWLPALLGREDVNAELLTGMSQAQKRRLTKGTATEIPHADRLIPQREDPRLVDVLEHGGMEPLVDELVERLADLRTQQATIAAAYARRKRLVDTWVAKRRGMSEKTWKFASRYGGYYRLADALHGPDGAAYSHVTSGNLNHTQNYAVGAHQAELLTDMDRAMVVPMEVTPGSPRYWEAIANQLGRHYADVPGEMRTAGGVNTRAIDPLFARALADGDREELVAEAIEWALTTPEGRNWVAGMGLRTQASVEAAVAAGERAAARRGAPPPAVTAEQRRTAHQTTWRETMDSPVVVDDVDVADVIRAQFNFAENWVLPNPTVRELFLTGRATPENLRAAYEANPWPLHTFVGLLTPTDAMARRVLRARRASNQSMNRLAARLSELGDRGLTKIGSGPETRMARHPVFQAIARADLSQRIRFAEQVEGRQLAFDELLYLRTQSQRFALKRMEETLYTLKSRSATDDFLRFVMPFLPAWRNTLHRWGRFALDNPGGVEKVSRFYNTTVNQIGWYDYTSGEQVGDMDDVDPKDVYTLLPGITALPVIGPAIERLSPGMAEALRRTKVPPRSLDVIFQGDVANPGLGPWVAAPAQAILDHQSQIKDSSFGKRLTRYLLPMGPEQTGSNTLDAAMAFLPSAVKPLVARTFDLPEWTASQNRIAATYFANGYDRDPLTGDPKSAEQIRAEINAGAGNMMIVKTLMYLVSPVSAQQVGDYEFYAGQMRSLRDTMPTLDEAEGAFLERFGDANWFYAVSSTFNLTGGMSLSQVVENQKQLGDVSAEAIDRYDNPRLLAFFENLGPNGEKLVYAGDVFNEYARNWQLKNAPTPTSGPYRGGKDPTEFIEDAKVRLGWHYFDKGMDAIDAALQQQGYVSGTADYFKERAKRTPAMSQYVGQLLPEWESERQKVDTGKAEDTAEFFTWAFTESDWAKRDGHAELPVVRSALLYLSARESVRSAIAARVAKDPGRPRSLQAAGNHDLYRDLMAVRDALAQGSLAFQDWVDTYFRSDNITIGRDPVFPDREELFQR